MKAPHYMVLEGSDLEAFVTAVNNYCLMGWRPQGGIAFRHFGSTPVFYQAMYREKHP